MIYMDILISVDLLSLQSEETEEPRNSFCVPIIFQRFFFIFYKIDKYKVTIWTQFFTQQGKMLSWIQYLLLPS